MREARLNTELSFEAGFRIFYDFFPEPLLKDLIALSLTGERKKIYPFDTDTPEAIKDAREIAQSAFGLEGLNTAIIKRYGLQGESNAFEMHVDPDKFQGRLVLCSIAGMAFFRAVNLNSGVGFETVCRPNSVIVVPADTLHQVSPPVSQYGVRSFLFFGHACPYIEN